MTLTAPGALERTSEQRLQALARGNMIRSRRSILKRDLKAGRRLVGPLIADPPDWLLSMRIYDLLVATPARSDEKAEKLLRRHGISPSKSVGGLSCRQRQALLAALGGAAR